MSSPLFVANLYWRFRITIVASDWRRGGTAAGLNGEPRAFFFFVHMELLFALFFLSSVCLTVYFWVTYACEFVHQTVSYLSWITRIPMCTMWL